MKFEEMKLNPLILKEIKKQGFTELTEIQQKCIPEIRKGHDVVGQSLTGSGKTLAFSMPIIEKIIPGKGVQALILTPTRELCVQVKDAFDTFGKALKISAAAVYGGTGMQSQFYALRKAEVVVATPGRLLDHINRGSVRFESLKFLVLDEVDRMLDMGFISSVDRIIQRLPKARQTLLFSATFSESVHALARKYLHNPVSVKAQTVVDKSLLKQVYYPVKEHEKFPMLLHLLKHKTPGFALVFCATRHHVNALTRSLQAKGVNSMAIHGGLSQNRRLYALEALKNEHIDVLVATDVAARGLDIKNVTHVYNYDVPKTSEGYTHRIGRTARAGKGGDAITILSQPDFENFRNVLADKSIEITEAEPPPPFEKAKFSIFAPRFESRGAPRRFGARGGSAPRRGFGARNSSGGMKFTNHGRRRNR